MEVVRGTVVQAGRFGAVVRLDDGRLATVASDDSCFPAIRRAVAERRRPAFEFEIVDESSGRPRVILAAERGSDRAPERAPSTSFEQKIADYLRQTAEWDPRGAASDLRPPKFDRHAGKRRS
ncbi:MAG TPA: hypothetical protein VII69_09005 [Candidatus Eremiobacteraceae bacterium]